MATDLNKKYRSLDQREMGKRIRHRREAMELSREDLAELLDVSAQFIADVEYGNKGLSIKRLYLLSQVLGVSTDYILAGSLYSFETDGEATRFREEIMELIYKCDAKQLKGIREITEIYVDGVNSK